MGIVEHLGRDLDPWNLPLDALLGGGQGAR